jgi:hypothetical protein
MKHNSRLILIIALLSVWLPGIGQAVATTGCRTGGNAAANAYVHMNPIYAVFYGSLQSYVHENQALFTEGSDAVRCLAALSQAAMSAAVQVYDPHEMQRRDAINAQLGSLGISPGPAQPSPASELYTMSVQLARLARTMPAAANGNFGPYYTPTNDLESMQIFAEQMFPQLMQNPMVRTAIAQKEGLIRQLAQIDFQIILHAAQRLSAGE